ncbi:MAG: 4-(cytidine 5'-diphospho)-2-C-methyl-D-erythritol kinase [Gammaproteobacteria bacterium]|nr:4-(cytidine 5'-diphospho)-2-C-methyl-D-erythritol kinase [Gammaproteobacteria bacterium]
MTRLTLDSPAKLNLMLHITGRRDDGYHLLQTVFQFIDLNDRMSFETTETKHIRRIASQTTVDEAGDIILRAAHLLQSRYRVEQGVQISIEKHIPIGGGLGGGSSNAATCLLALNALWELNLSLEKLAEIGLELGADVPVFVLGKAAWASGIGEQLTPVQLAKPNYLVIQPQIAVSTAEIFNAEQLTRVCDAITIRAFLDGAGANVCEPVVRAHYPEVGEALDWLSQFGDARLTGTGACIYAPFDSLHEAEGVKSRVPAQWRGYVARGLNQNPVHAHCRIYENNV